MQALKRALLRLAYPMYSCEVCVGQEPWQGCYCAYHGGVAPGVGPEWWRAKMQRFLEAIGWGIRY